MQSPPPPPGLRAAITRFRGEDDQSYEARLEQIEGFIHQELTAANDHHHHHPQPPLSPAGPTRVPGFPSAASSAVSAGYSTSSSSLGSVRQRGRGGGRMAYIERCGRSIDLVHITTHTPTHNKTKGRPRLAHARRDPSQERVGGGVPGKDTHSDSAYGVNCTCFQPAIHPSTVVLSTVAVIHQYTYPHIQDRIRTMTVELDSYCRSESFRLDFRRPDGKGWINPAEAAEGQGGL